LIRRAFAVGSDFTFDARAGIRFGILDALHVASIVCAASRIWRFLGGSPPGATAVELLLFDLSRVAGIEWIASLIVIDWTLWLADYFSPVGSASCRPGN
jgi:hypothetical protein